MVTPVMPVLQGSDTICPECGLKDDGSPMIGKVWSHQQAISCFLGWGNDVFVVFT